MVLAVRALDGFDSAVIEVIIEAVAVVDCPCGLSFDDEYEGVGDESAHMTTLKFFGMSTVLTS